MHFLRSGGQSVVILQVPRFFSRFVKKCSPELCQVSAVQFMTVVYVEQPKESAFSRCLWQRMMHTEDGVMSGLERLRKPGKWTRIVEKDQ